jgi:hypothetical protein
MWPQPASPRTKLPFLTIQEGQDAYALNKLPNSFPRTKSNIEITLLKKIFLPVEANLAGQLTGIQESVSAIAQRVGLSEPKDFAAWEHERIVNRGLA